MKFGELGIGRGAKRKSRRQNSNDATAEGKLKLGEGNEISKSRAAGKTTEADAGLNQLDGRGVEQNWTPTKKIRGTDANNNTRYCD
jgi:hypothetical protein